VCDKVFYFNFKEVSRSHNIFYLFLFMKFFFIIFLISRLMFWWRRCVNYLLLTSLPKPLFQSKKKDFIKRCVIFSSYFLLLLVNSFSSFVSFFARKTWPSLQGGQTGTEPEWARASLLGTSRFWGNGCGVARYGVITIFCKLKVMSKIKITVKISLLLVLVS
jgi:hypothetical protein